MLYGIAGKSAATWSFEGGMIFQRTFYQGTLWPGKINPVHVHHVQKSIKRDRAIWWKQAIGMKEMAIPLRFETKILFLKYVTSEIESYFVPKIVLSFCLFHALVYYFMFLSCVGDTACFWSTCACGDLRHIQIPPPIGSILERHFPEAT